MSADPVPRNLGLERWLLPDEEGSYRWIEPCREAVGALVCAGTAFVMCRSALVPKLSAAAGPALPGSWCWR